MARAIQPWLLAKMTVAVVGEKSNSVRSVHSHTASLVAFAEAMYSASTEEVVTVGCFFEDQVTELPATSKTKPLVDRQ